MATAQTPQEPLVVPSQGEAANEIATPRAPSSGTQQWVKDAIAFSERMDQDEPFRQAVAGHAS